MHYIFATGRKANNNQYFFLIIIARNIAKSELKAALLLGDIILLQYIKRK